MEFVRFLLHICLAKKTLNNFVKERLITSCTNMTTSQKVTDVSKHLLLRHRHELYRYHEICSTLGTLRRVSPRKQTVEPLGWYQCIILCLDIPN